MTLHACTLHGCIEDKVDRRGACMGACMLAEYERMVTPIHGSAGDEETVLYGRCMLINWREFTNEM